MHWWNVRRQGLSYLAHTLGQVLLIPKHITLGHEELNVAFEIDQSTDEHVSPVAQGLTNRVKKDGNKVHMLCEPLVNALNIKFVLQTAVSKSWSVNEDNLFEIAQFTGRGFHGHAIQKTRESLLLRLPIKEFLHEWEHLDYVVATEFCPTVSVHH